MITVTAHESAEWARFAQAAYAAGHTAIGHRYSAASAILRGQRIPAARFDALQDGYRAWLCLNTFPAA